MLGLKKSKPILKGPFLGYVWIIYDNILRQGRVWSQVNNGL